MTLKETSYACICLPFLGSDTLNSPDMDKIVPLLFFNNDIFGIKLPIKVDMPLSKETNPLVLPLTRAGLLTEKLLIMSNLNQSTGAIEYTDCTSAEG